jgi:TonB family protein
LSGAACVTPPAPPELNRWIASFDTAMQMMLRILVFSVAFLAVCTIGGQKQANSHAFQSDDDMIYAVDEVDVKAKIKNKLENLPDRKNDCPDPVHVSLRVVLRKSGKVTDVTIVKSSGCSYDREAIKAVLKLKFNPAVKGGQPVSQYSGIEYRTTSQ